MPASRHSSATASRSRGRPREFKLDQVLDRAVRVFSERGYHGASIADLAHATHLAQGSLYKAFKDKQGLFLAALDRYLALRSEKRQLAIDEGANGLERLRNVLTVYIESSQGAEGRQGCLVVASMAELSTFEKPVARHLAAALDRNEALLADLIRLGQEDGSIPTHVDREAAARMLLCLTQGMRVVGKAGRSREAMQSVVDAALKALD